MTEEEIKDWLAAGLQLHEYGESLGLDVDKLLRTTEEVEQMREERSTPNEVDMYAAGMNAMEDKIRETYGISPALLELPDLKRDNAIAKLELRIKELEEKSSPEKGLSPNSLELRVRELEDRVEELEHE